MENKTKPDNNLTCSRKKQCRTECLGREVWTKATEDEINVPIALWSKVPVQRDFILTRRPHRSPPLAYAISRVVGDLIMRLPFHVSPAAW